MPWVPKRPADSACGLVWLPRLIDKARRVHEGQQQGVDLITPYMFGDNDYLDAKLLAFLRLRDDVILDVVATESDDGKAAEMIVAISGRQPDDCRRWSDRFLRWEAPLIWIIDVDEDRSDGPAADAGRWFYNRILFPPVFQVFRWMEGRRPKA